jgi:hypothetical protein
VLTGIVAKSSFPLLGTRIVPSKVGHGVVRNYPLQRLWDVGCEKVIFLEGPMRKVSQEESILSLERTFRDG